MAEAARRLTDAADGFLAGPRALRCERDGQGTEGLRHNVEGTGVRIGPTPIPARLPLLTESASCARAARSISTA